MSENKEPKYIQRIRAMEQRYQREAKEGELRLQNDIDYAKSNMVRLTGTEVAAQITEFNPFVGKIMSKVFTADNYPKRRLSSPENQLFRPLRERSTPADDRSTALQFGIKTALENVVLPAALSIIKMKIIAAGIKTPSKLLQKLLRGKRKKH